MIEIAEIVEPSGDPEHLWPLLRQVGIRRVVTLLEGAEQQSRWLRGVPGGNTRPAPEAPRGERGWELAALRRARDAYRSAGFELSVVEDTPPLDDARLGGRRRDEQIENLLDQIRAMGSLGIEVLCYNWLAVATWARTDIAQRTRGDALTTAYRDADARREQPLIEPGMIDHDGLWLNFEYFLRAVVPVAEEAGVRLALHPDDPPLPEVRGIPRIMGSLAAFQRVLDLVPSPANGITLCQGNFALMTADLPAAIRHFGQQRRIHFIHLRDVRGSADDFQETFHDQGPTDLAACLRAYHDTGFTGLLRPDHVPTLHGESNAKPGYAVLGRLHAAGYIRGLLETVQGKTSD